MERFLHALIAIAVFSMMALIFTDVFLRYFFNAPLVGALEIVQFQLAIIIFSALPIVTATNGHVVVSLFEACFHGPGRAVRQVCISLISAGALGLICWLMVLQGASAVRFQKVVGYLELPVAWLVYAMAALSALALLVHVMGAAAGLARLGGRT